MDLAVTTFDDGAAPDRPILVLGPSLGTSARSLWTRVARALGAEFRVYAWDLPGHGDSGPAADVHVRGLAAALLAALDRTLGAEAGQSFHYAGNSVGGAVGLQLMLDTPERVRTATLLGTGARIGAPDAWTERGVAVRAWGTKVLVDATPAGWFSPGFADRDPETAKALLDALGASDPMSYAAVCDALAGFDVRDRLDEIGQPVLAVAGADDVSTPPTSLRHLAEGVPHGRLVVLPGVGHLPPAERPDLVATLITDHSRAEPEPTPAERVRAAGMRVRREVLGDAHVDQASAGASALTAEFQEFITTYAWGSIWTRPGLDRRSRSLITLTALVARGHYDELAMHLRAARTNGLTNDEIKELLLQTAIYCGVPEANAAFRVAQAVLADLDDRSGDSWADY